MSIGSPDTGGSTGWKLLRPVEVTKKNKIDLINDLSHLVHNDPIEKECVAWSYDTLQDAMIVSNGELSGDRYSYRGKSGYLQTNEKVIPPAKLRDAVEGETGPGSVLYYLADREMLDSEVSSALLLTTEQISGQLNSIKPVR
jgi:hypothetical protein